MTEHQDEKNRFGRPRSRFRLAAWAGAGFLLLVPLVAMQFTDEVDWNVADFAFMAALLLVSGVTLELAARKTGDSAYRAAVAVAVGAAFLLIWVNGAVGIIGSENNDANLMFFGVLAVGVFGALIARFRPHGMARALLATAIAQTSVAAIALVAGFGSEARDILGLTAFFVILWVGSAWLFQKATRGAAQRGLV